MVNHVIFDFDGTIVDSLNLAVEIYNDLAEKYRFVKISEEDFKYLGNISIAERSKFLQVPFYRLPIFTREFMHNYRKSIDSLQTFAGMNELILELKQKGFKLSIISSNSAENVGEFLRKNKMDIFDVVNCISNIFGKDKAIRRFINKYNLNRAELIYIGDENRDIEACKLNNIKIIAVSWGIDSVELLEGAKPDYIVDSPAEILQLLTNRL